LGTNGSGIGAGAWLGEVAIVDRLNYLRGPDQGYSDVILVLGYG